MELLLFQAGADLDLQMSFVFFRWLSLCLLNVSTEVFQFYQ